MPRETLLKKSAAKQRPYRGVKTDERRQRRRLDLIAAAIAVYGKRGYRQSTVKAVCDQAGLTERYFYESFENSEALLAACYEAVTLAVFANLLKAGAEAKVTGNGDAARAERMRAMLRAYFRLLEREPRSAQLFLTEIRGVGPVVDATFASCLREFGRAISETLAPPGARRDSLLEAGVVGGIMHIASRWIGDGHRPSVNRVADTALKLCAGIRVED
jgi:AcrR family transcriptional regulator